MAHLPVHTSDAERERRAPEIIALGPDAPTVNELFVFMRDAELRFDSLRMRIEDRTYGARGETVETSEVWLRHPGRAKVVTRTGGDTDGVSRDFRVWITDGERVRTYDGRANVASVRPVRDRVEGVTAPDLPAFARVYTQVTDLPMETLVDTFVHPNGYCRNVLATARLELLGTTTLVQDREAFVLRASHPRTTQVLTDRPDHSIEVGVDRMTGLILMLVDQSGDQVARHALVTDLELDAPVGDDAFELFLGDDVRRIY
jgi:outer membrane lipoprotein-sorting protein